MRDNCCTYHDCWVFFSMYSAAACCALNQFITQLSRQVFAVPAENIFYEGIFASYTNSHKEEFVASTFRLHFSQHLLVC